MSDDDQATDKTAIRSLAELFDRDSKRFEWIAKQYYDLFAYHAAQRLTAFNFFLVSLSFFSTAYATLISKSDVSGSNYFRVASALAFAAYLLVIAFGRLDKRNEQIISINEKPLIRIQSAIRLGLAEDGCAGDEVWETFVQSDKSVFLRTFSSLLPTIYTLAAMACAAGAMYGLGGTGEKLDHCLAGGWVFMTFMAIVCIHLSLFRRRSGEAARTEANKVKRPVKADGAAGGAQVAATPPTDVSVVAPSSESTETLTTTGQAPNPAQSTSVDADTGVAVRAAAKTRANPPGQTVPKAKRGAKGAPARPPEPPES